jgi:trk system potassium uptake protein TrkA
MRIVIISADDLAVATARRAIARGHDVVIVEKDKERIEALSDELDCGFLNGDGSKPAILREAGPEDTHVLLSIGPDDQSNILASLVGRSLGFGRVITKIIDPEFQHICAELGLDETVIPNSAMARTLADMAEGRQVYEVSALLRGDLHFFGFVADEATAGPVEDLDLPAHSKLIAIYREDEPILPGAGATIEANDQVILLADDRAREKLTERFGRQATA